VTVWATLGIAATTDRGAIRRAYAKALRATHPEDDAEGFKALRAAYEMALAYGDHATWGDIPDDAEQTESHDVEVLPRQPAFRSEPVEQAAPDDADWRTEREAEIARLNALLATLAQALHGPWHADEAMMRETLATILKQPALGEIALYAEVEQAVAGMLAATIPRSDAILFEAANAFGWTGERAPAVSPPVAAVLARLDEWRLIDTFKRRNHPLRPAWRSLTRPPRRYWLWRIAALRPGVEAGVATLLGRDGPVPPGLSYSFQAASVERWRHLLDRPHWTRGMAAAIPLMAVLSIFLFNGVGLSWPGDGPIAGWCLCAAILLSPLAPFAAQVTRARWLRRRHPEWMMQGWIGGVAVVLLGAMLMPASAAALLALTAASALAWAWMAVAGGQAPRAERIARLRASWLPILLCALFGTAAAGMLDPVHRAVLALMLALGATLITAPFAPVASLLARLPRWRAGLAVPVVLAIGGIAYGAARLVVPGDDAQILYAATLTLIAGSTVIAAAQISGVRGNGEYTILRLLRVAVLGAFLFAAIVAIGDASTPDAAPAATILMT
jgi:hypothetical protein